MMRFIRENAIFVVVVIVFVVAMFIGTIFMVWGRGDVSQGGGEKTVVAWVGKEEIPYADYLRAYDSRQNFYRRFYPNLSTTEMEKRFKLKKSALDAVVGRRLLLDEARRLGLMVVDEEVRRKIEENSAFHENGKFDPARYRSVLASSGLTPRAFEEETRTDLLVEKVRAMVQETVQVSPEEAYQEFRREKEKVRLEVVAAPARDEGAAPQPGADEVAREFERNPDKYALPERVQLAWAALRAADYGGGADPSVEDLRRWYDAHLEEFKSGKTVRARHILFSLKEDAPADEVKKVQDRAEMVRDKAKSGADFAELAKEFSQDSSGPRGGDLGWFGAGQMVPAFEQAAFALAKGAVSDLVRTQFGFHVIKVEDIREARTRGFEEALEEVRARERRDRARVAVTAKVEELNDQLYGADFEEVARRLGLTVQRTGLLSRKDTLPGAAARPEVADALFALAEGEVSEVYRSGEDYYVYRVAAKKAAAAATLDEARPQVVRELAQQAARDRRVGAARLLRAELERGVPAEAVAAKSGGTAKLTSLFARGEFVAEAGVPGSVFEEAFGLADGAVGGPVSSDDGRVFVFRVKGRVAATKEEFASEREKVSARIRNEKKEAFFESWLEDLRRARAVKVNDALVGPLEPKAERG